MVRQVDPREITQAAVVSLRAIQVDVGRQVNLREITQAAVDRQVVIGRVTLLAVVDQLVTVRDAKKIR